MGKYMSSKWQQHWRKKAKRSIYWYLCLLLSVCFTQSINVRVFERALGVNHGELFSLRAQTLSEDQLFKKMIERAAAAYKEKRFKDAIQHFERAMMLNPNPNIHWNLAVCYYKVANYQKALSNTNAYLENGSPSEKMKRKVEAKKKDILYHLQRAYLAPKVNPNDSQPVATVEQKQPVISQRPAPIINPEPLDMFEMNPQAIQDEPAQKAPPNSYGGTSQESNYSSNGKRNLIIWGSVSAVLLASSIGLHMYGDQVWETRPNGGGTLAQEARRDALLFSWVGDASLALSLTSLVIGLISYVNDADNSYSQYQTQMGGAQNNSTLGHISFELLSNPTLASPNTRQPSANGGLLGWQFTF